MKFPGVIQQFLLSNKNAKVFRSWKCRRLCNEVHVDLNKDTYIADIQQPLSLIN